VFETYGRDHAALCSTVIRYRARGALRDVGKALGTGYGTVRPVVWEGDAERRLPTRSHARVFRPPTCTAWSALRRCDGVGGCSGHVPAGLNGVNFCLAGTLAGFGSYVAVYLTDQKWPLRRLAEHGDEPN
jgi:hypothetical protein